MTPTVAVASDFFDAFARIPRSQQRKVREFTEKFRINPRSSGINYEKIRDVKDDRVRTVRISKAYRAIVLHPEEGNVYVLVWVDHHDEAMDWAKRKTFEINPRTGALQVFSVTEAEKAIEEEKEKTSERAVDGDTGMAKGAEEAQKEAQEEPGTGPVGLLYRTTNDVLLSFGVPEVLLPAVRAVETRKQLAGLTDHLPAEAGEALTWLAEDIPADEVRRLLEATKAEKETDSTDLEAALEHPDTRRRFVKITTPHDLAVMLNAPLEKWRVFLHPNQERLVRRDFNGPARVLGGAGTGKTVVAMHRARHLAARVFTDETDRVLFTTFTRNLAESIEQNLKTLCEDEIERIEVVHLHAWAVRFMRSQEIKYDIASGAETGDCWRQALAIGGELDFDAGFLRQEWDEVVQAQGITTRDEYLRARRIGRRKTLSRKQRAQVWKVFEEYREQLRGMNKVEWLEVIRETRKYLESRPGLLPYRGVVVDEAQDLHPEEWRLIRALVPEGKNDLFIVGDAHQRIYARRVVLSQCGIHVRGRSRKLRINYRTTRQIKTWAVRMLEGVEYDDLDGGRDDQKGYTSLLTGPDPELHGFLSLEEEQEFVGRELKRLLEGNEEQKPYAPEEICLVARTHKSLRENYAPALRQAGIEFAILDPNEGAKPPSSAVRLATMHRVKGLEFRCMMLAGVSEGEVPLRRPGIADDPTARAEHEAKERSLLFVSATRARDRLIISWAGEGSRYLG